MDLTVLLIVKILANSGLAIGEREAISYCTLHGVQYGQQVDLEKKFQYCVRKESKNYKYDSNSMQILKKYPI